MKVVFFHRKQRPGNFSIESLFKHIREHLPSDVLWEVVELRFRSQGFFKRLYISLEAFFRQKDINHITGDVNFIALFLNRKKTVLTIHDVGFMGHPNRFYRFLLLWFWIKLPIYRSSVITTVSHATRLELLKHVHLSTDKMKVIYVPIAAHFQPDPKIFNSAEPCILQIGTKHNKNVPRLIQALRDIPCRLEIIGELDENIQQALANSTIKFNHSKNLTGEEVIDKYRAADIVSFASTYEGFGMPILEANAMGRVVITSNILSMPEVAGDAAHLVDPFDVLSIHNGILEVIHNVPYRESLIENGYRNVKRFSVNRIAEQYTEIYRQLYSEAV